MITEAAACSCVLLLTAAIDPAVTALSALGIVITVPVLIVRAARGIRRHGFPWRGLAGTASAMTGTACLMLLPLEQAVAPVLYTATLLAASMGALAILAAWRKIRDEARRDA